MEDIFTLNQGADLNYFRLLMQIISGLLFIYSIAITIRIILSWVRMGHTSRFAEFIGKLVDPYLNIFRGLPFLRIGPLDFSPVMGIVLISFVIDITSQLAATGYISGWHILYLLIGSLWRIVSFLLSFLIIVFLVRLVTTQIHSLKNNPFLTSFDSMIYSISSGILGLFVRKPVSFVKAIIITLFFLIALRVGGEIGIKYLDLFLRKIMINAGT